MSRYRIVTNIAAYDARFDTFTVVDVDNSPEGIIELALTQLRLHGVTTRWKLTLTSVPVALRELQRA